METADLQGTTRRTEARCDFDCGWSYLQGHVYRSNLIQVGGSCHDITSKYKDGKNIKAKPIAALSSDDKCFIIRVGKWLDYDLNDSIIILSI
jgi:hypothetical protein